MSTAGHPRLRLAGLALALALLATAPAYSQQDVDVADLVFVTEDTAVNSPGCDAISAFNAETGEVASRGMTMVSPGRMSAAHDLSVIVAINSNLPPEAAPRRFLYAMTPMLVEGNWRFSANRIEGAHFTFNGGIAVEPSGETLVVTESATGSTITDTGPYVLRAYELLTIRSGSLGDAIAESALGKFPAGEILFSKDGTTVYVIQTDGTLLTLAGGDLSQLSAPVALAPFAIRGAARSSVPASLVHASLSPDGRTLVANRWGSPDLNIVDVTSHSPSTVTVPGVDMIGGVAFNHGPANAGLLAIHAVDELLVAGLRTDGKLQVLSRAAIDRPYPMLERGEQYDRVGPNASVGWGRSGQQVIAATSPPSHLGRPSSAADFATYEVTQDGSGLVLDDLWVACEPGGNMPNDILTANGLAVPPSATPTSNPTTTSTPTMVPSPTTAAIESATPTPSAEPTVTATASATSSTAALFLPLLLREHCSPGRQRVDVAVVLDASTSMRDDRTATGRTKLSAATEAAGLLLDTLSMPLDQAAVIAFNREALVVQSLTGRRADLDAALNEMPGLIRSQTRIDLGIDSAHQELVGPRRRPANRAVMIVLTDGLANPEPASSAVRAARFAKDSAITVFTVGLGEDDDLNVADLREIASRPEYFYRSPDGDDLASIYSAIAITLPCTGDRFWGWR